MSPIESGQSAPLTKEQQYLDVAEIMIVALDADAHIKHINKKGCRVLGYAEHEIIDKSWFEICILEDKQKEIRDIFNQIISGDITSVEYYENEILTKNGDLRTIAFHNSLLLDDLSQITGVLFSGEDITQRKQAEEALKKSEKRFRSLFECVGDYALVLEAQQEGPPIIADANDAAFAKHGYTRQEMIGKPISFIDIKSTLKEINQRVEMLKKDGSSRFEVEHVCKDGSTFTAETVIRMVEYQNETLIYSIERDITERKLDEQALKESERKLRTVIDQSPVSMELFDMTGFQVQVNRAWEIMWDATPENGIGKFNILTDPQMKESPIYPQIEEAFNGHKQFIEEWYFDPKVSDFAGRARFMRSHIYPIKNENGEIQNIVLTHEDITERKRTEESLHKLSSAIEQAGESIIITDREGIIEYANPAFTTLTGYSAEEAIGQTPRMLKSGNQDAAFYKEMWDIISSGKVWHGKVIDRKKDGSFYPTTLTISPIIDQSGNETSYSHFVGIQSDLTEIENLQYQFHQAQKMEAIGTLVGGIAHDFNNMLAGITGNLYLAMEEVQELPRAVQRLDNIEGISFRAADMIQQLLTFARKGMVSIKPIPLNPFIKETLKLLRTSVPENIELHQDICSETLQINGDNTQLHQVLLNLIGNARDAVDGMDNPTITIRLEAWHPDQTFMSSHSYFKDQPYAHLSVEDNGIGIPEHQIEHLFEPFFTTKEVGKGIGLGLAMTFGAIKTHHGFVEVDSSEGKGSTFHIYIPLLQTEEAALPPAKETEVIKGHGELILLVDDEPEIIKTGKAVLESLGYQVLTAINGQEAIDIFNEHSEEIELCIFDIVMPIMGGDKAAQSIRKIKPHMKVIFSTGYDKNKMEGMENEAVLSKPFPIKEMSSLIRKQFDS